MRETETINKKGHKVVKYLTHTEALKIIDAARAFQKHKCQSRPNYTDPRRIVRPSARVRLDNAHRRDACAEAQTSLRGAIGAAR